MIDTQTDFPEDVLHLRKERHELRDRAGVLLDTAADRSEPGRVARCGRRRTGPTVEVWVNPEGGAHFRGLETCGSIWTCPVCASKIATRRTAEVEALTQAHMTAGGGLYMATLTLRHKSFQSARELRWQVARAWEKAQQGGAWVRLKADLGIIGTVRALEVTHGKSGWHPHLHVLIFTGAKLSERRQDDLEAALWARWSSAVRRVDGTCDEKAFHLREASTASAGAAYVAKWGAGQEIAKGAHKDAAGQSVWDLLKASEHDARAGRLFVEFATAFKGARHLTYARGLREWYGLRDPLPDEELALEGYQHSEVIDTETGEIIAQETGRVAVFDSGTWNRVIRLKLTADILSAAIKGGTEAVEFLLSQHDCHSYFDAREMPAPNYKPPPSPHKRAFDPGGGFGSMSEVMAALKTWKENHL
ncbi:protein rep [Parvibaculum sp.]|uniref:protein rep n=1 Tax=Parvibaculum sp. TaxID=2024848 RepID=UPI0025D6CC52|nr:protein rep [Parvibaculum sp.]